MRGPDTETLRRAFFTALFAAALTFVVMCLSGGKDYQKNMYQVFSLVAASVVAVGMFDQASETHDMSAISW
jgi:hypothetical protein